MMKLVAIEDLDIWGVGLIGVAGVIPLIHDFAGGLLYFMVTVAVIDKHLRGKFNFIGGALPGATMR